MSPSVGSQRYGIVDDVDPLAVAHGQPVVGDRAGHHPGEQAGVVHLDQGGTPSPPSRTHPNLVGVRPQDPDHRAVRVRVRAEHRVRVVVGTAEQPVDGRLVRRAWVDGRGAPAPGADPRPAGHLGRRGPGRRPAVAGSAWSVAGLPVTHPRPTHA